MFMSYSLSTEAVAQITSRHLENILYEYMYYIFVYICIAALTLWTDIVVMILFLLLYDYHCNGYHRSG
jgi:hypothetical protein